MAKALTETERLLVDIWGEMLNRDVDVDQQFFELGGDSIMVMMVLLRLEETLGIYVDPADLFEAPVLRDFARRVEMLRTDVELVAVEDGVV